MSFFLLWGKFSHYVFTCQVDQYQYTPSHIISLYHCTLTKIPPSPHKHTPLLTWQGYPTDASSNRTRSYCSHCRFLSTGDNQKYHSAVVTTLVHLVPPSKHILPYSLFICSINGQQEQFGSFVHTYSQIHLIPPPFPPVKSYNTTNRSCCNV